MNSGFDKSRANEESTHNLEADYQLGMDIISGRAEDKDLPEAVSLFREAALQGHPGAQYELGVSRRIINHSGIVDQLMNAMDLGGAFKADMKAYYVNNC